MDRSMAFAAHVTRKMAFDTWGKQSKEFPNASRGIDVYLDMEFCRPIDGFRNMVKRIFTLKF